MVPMGGIMDSDLVIVLCPTPSSSEVPEPMCWQCSERAALWAQVTAPANRLAPPWLTIPLWELDHSPVLFLGAAFCHGWGVIALQLGFIYSLLHVCGWSSVSLGPREHKAGGCWLEATVCKLRAMYSAGWGWGQGGGRHSGSWVHCAVMLGTYLSENCFPPMAWFKLLIKCHDQFVFL